jgi:hypothetical protein
MLLTTSVAVALQGGGHDTDWQRLANLVVDGMIWRRMMDGLCTYHLLPGQAPHAVVAHLVRCPPVSMRAAAALSAHINCAAEEQRVRCVHHVVQGSTGTSKCLRQSRDPLLNPAAKTRQNRRK